MNIDIHHVKSIRMNDKRTSTLDDGREFTSGNPRGLIGGNFRRKSRVREIPL